MGTRKSHPSRNLSLEEQKPYVAGGRVSKTVCCTQIMGNTYHVSQEEEAAEEKQNPTPMGEGQTQDLGSGL